MYVIESRHGYTTLHEMTKRELAENQKHYADRTWYAVSAAEAHRFVIRNGVHTTGLWLDDLGRIRKAQKNNT